jgi:hypothetical protein
MTVVVTHSTPADGSFSTEGATAWNADHTLSGVGTLAEQDANAVAITGGTINGATVGATTPAAGTFTTLGAQNATLRGTGQNLLLQSQTYTNATWNSSSATRADNQTTAPNGTNTAGTITSVNATFGGLLRQFNTFTSTTYTLSAFVKKNNWRYVGLRCGNVAGTGDRFAFFDFDTLATNTVGIAGATFTATDAGNGWYRIVLTGINTTLGSTVADLGIVASDGASGTNTGAGNIVNVWGVQLELGPIANTYIPTTTAAVYGTPALSFSGVTSVGLQSDGSLYASSAGTGNVRLYTNNITQEQARIAHTASAVNFVQVTGAATGSGVAVSAQGSDSNVSLGLAGKGTGPVLIVNSGSTAAPSLALASTNRGFYSASGGVIGVVAGGNDQLRILNTAGAANYATIAGGATNTSPTFGVAGSDTNISQVFQSKGTGAINLAPGSSGVNISNGGTVTALTRTNAGGNYTSFPAIAISAPTTTGGVQATVSIAFMQPQNATIGAGGTGYTVNDVLTIVGGTPTAGAATFTVTAVSGGVITAASSTNFATYSVLPTNPVSVTGGTGSGATLNIFYGVSANPGSFTITNAGSGYVEQPTVTFSGGGGSGAAAYATVGSGTTVRSLGGTMSFVTPGGEQVRIVDSGTTSTSFLNFRGGAGGCAIFPTGASSEMNIGSSGGFNLRFFTSGVTNEQLRVANTSSAVNFVQVTGAATGGATTISSQGSDATVSMLYAAKGGSAVHQFRTNGTANIGFQITAGTSAVNFVNANGVAAGSAPSLAAQGSDTNIDLALTPKGTGNVRFGTFTSSVLTPTGFIEIKDSSGTIRRLLVG